MISKAKKQELILKFGKNAKNTGDTAVQIAILTEDIEKLKVHFEKNKKDKHSMRGFIAKVNKRKKLLSYLKQKSFETYKETIEALNIRK
ncbi:30S ribosomal protein S15 [Mesomycoplasma ovipneumoniae]|uniref:Small ribosomal subunit protein uS15 n=2 Tax=Mesomycoplasma ovipneumoniae TaxID=29562 RepID=A0AAJ2P668_9BACT|nr:30S ribosomal protein S15 [Mesomycoplasma ovipneumoniae]EXU60986.1 30S ribosomal protein S15 [Mesomycoplasma ovipneumoniae 14811]MCP9306555.1 30S ribosomal protein S15 [Mesomycoplasma ovipneumoniae]MDF9627825.1 30S ribosomal protein S15 [Mesomycoplasma ovipneumoniae]MDO4158077.1 30S ribosomal protein S15 [Mesomycoplasma ovipneumoniae]MDO4158226.1 30S ribosomal protein S15 [Mesomycoplasma ovipneumoniae]